MPANPDDLSVLRDTWAALCAPAGVAHGGLAFGLIAAAYAEPARHYHTAAHVADCLRELQPVRGLCTDALAASAALLFHDFAHDPTRHDNEERSADEARRALRAIRWPPLTIDAVAAMILVTRHTHPPATPDEAIVADIDLTVLGRSPEEFGAYERAIRQEYAHVPDAAFRAGRAAILRHFLARPRLYSTDYFSKRCESQARQNLAQSLAVLEA